MIRFLLGLAAALWLAITPAQAFVGQPVVSLTPSTGSANAQVVASLVPGSPSFSLANGAVVWFQAGYTNTGPLTLAVGGTAAKNVMLGSQTGPQNLNSGEVVLGNWYLVMFDGTEYQILDPTLSASSCVSLAGNLLGTTGGANVQTGNYSVSASDACGLVYETNAAGAAISLPKPTTTTGFPTGFVNYFSTTIANAGAGIVAITSTANIYTPGVAAPATQFNLLAGYSAQVFTDGTSWYIIPQPNFTKTFYSGSSGPSSQAANTTYYYPLGGISSGSLTQTAVTTFFPAGTFVSLAVQASAYPGANDSVVATIYQNGNPTALTCTISGAGSGAVGCTITGSVSSSAGQSLSLQIVTSALATAPIYEWYVQFNPR